MAPGPVLTPILGEFVQMLGEDRVAADAAKIKRPALADEVAPPILFLIAAVAIFGRFQAMEIGAAVIFLLSFLSYAFFLNLFAHMSMLALEAQSYLGLNPVKHFSRL